MTINSLKLVGYFKDIKANSALAPCWISTISYPTSAGRIIKGIVVKYFGFVRLTVNLFSLRLIDILEIN